MKEAMSLVVIGDKSAGLRDGPFGSYSVLPKDFFKKEAGHARFE